MKKNLSRLFATFITSLLLLTSCRSTTMSDFTVTFNGNGGTLISGTEVQKVQNASEIVPPTYERMGYNFDGWNKNINTISVDTTVNAKWLEKSKDTSLSIEGFSQDGSLFSFKVNNDVNIFSYTDKVTISSKSSWKLFSDIEGKIEVVTKTISLSVGDNTNYILVTSENGEYAFYTVVTRRLNMFTVNFDTDGGTIIPSQQVQEESLIQEVANPEKPHYTFSSWDYDFSEPVMRNMTVTASYAINKYEITFKNYDGTTLQKTEWDYNSTPVYYGSTPVRNSTAQYTYSFSGWSPMVVAVTGNATYTAQFTNTTRTYTIIWKNYDGTIIETDTNVAYGVIPNCDTAIRVKPSDAQYTYTFSGWSPAVTAVTGNQTYIAQFTSSTNQYLITFKNYNGATLQSSNWAYGSTPSYSGATPTRPKSAKYTYAFSGWSPTVEAVTGNATYTAQFTSSINNYTITWQNYDGTTLEVDSDVPYGMLPTYDGMTPTKPSTSNQSYIWKGWSPTVITVTGNTTYKAKFDEVTIGTDNCFGSYPQTKVTDSVLIDQLNTAAGILPTSANSQTWTSYGFYISGSNSTNFMWYKDITNGADKYRGVYFISYRPYFTTNSSSTSNSYQDDYGYTTSTRYWFKYEPIAWEVLSADETGGPLLVADKILDGRDYYNSTSSRTIGGVTVYANNYKESNIRSWLNNDFYNQAFSTTEQSLINTTTVDNSVASTGYSSNPYACENTNDKIFLLSYVEATSSAYDTSRTRQVTDYAKAMGVHTNNSNGSNSSGWWLRSPYDTPDYMVPYATSVISTYGGVLPAFRINL